MKLWPFSRDSIETRDADLKDEDEVLHALWSGLSSGSVAVTGAEALRVPAVSNAVRVISEAAATLRVRVMVRGDDGTETEDTDHDVGQLLRGDVNPWSSGFDLVRDLTADALTRDWGGLGYVNRVRGETREIIRYMPAAISVTYDPWTAEPTYRIDGKVTDRRNIIHVRGPFDRCPLTLAAEAIGVAREMERHAGGLFRRGAKPGGFLKTEKKVGDSGVKKMLAGFRASHDGSANSGKTGILWDGVQWEQMMLSSVDAQFIELRKFQILEIARAFRVSPTMLFDFERATWSNGEQAGKEFLTYTLEPWLRAIETALGRALFTRDERATHRILLDRDDLTRADLTTRATAISSLISAKVLNPNEARSWLDLAPYEGGNEYGNPHINTDIPKPGDIDAALKTEGSEEGKPDADE